MKARPPLDATMTARNLAFTEHKLESPVDMGTFTV